MPKDKQKEGLLAGQNFESYYNLKMVQEWQSKYFEYARIKQDVHDKYHEMVEKIKAKRGVGEGQTNPKFINFGEGESNKEYVEFLGEVKEIIKEDFSRVGFISY